jgi:putative ABC transport system permease protein
VIDTLVGDLRDSARSLWKHPRFLTIASLTLALGIGAVTSIFSVVNGVLFTPLPYPHADRLVNIWSTAPGIGYNEFPVSPDLFLFFKRNNQVFEDMALTQARRANLTESGTPEVVDASVTTQSYFATLGVGFAQGRAYTADEDTEKGPRVVVVSNRLWTRRYGRDAGLVGRTIRIDGEPTTVVGIAPGWMDRTGSPDLWMPARFNPENPPTGNFGWNAVGRLKPGIEPDHAERQLEPLVQRAMSEYIQSANYRAFLTDGKYRPLVHSMREDIIGDVREPLWILLGTVGMVLLIACGNVANLFLVRAEARQREIAVRIALGSSRGALVRKLLSEAAVLSTIGTTLGVAFAAVAVPLLLRLAPETIPRLDQVQVNGTVLLFAIGAAVVSAVIFGLVPAVRYSRADVIASLRHGGRSATDHPSRHRGRHALVIAQTAMALVLLVGSGLLARSFMRLMSTDQGFIADNVLTFRVAVPQTTYPKAPEVVRFTQQLVDRLAQLPSVESAGATSELPVVAGTSGTAFEIEGRPVAAGQVPPIIHLSTVTTGYFKTLKIALLRGSDFDTSDQRDGVRTILINKAAADQYWPGQDAIGKRLRGAGNGADGQRPPWYTVKGIVANVRHEGLREAPRALLYFPLNEGRNDVPRALSYLLRGPNVHAQADAVRQAVWSLNPDLPVASVQSMNEAVERSVTQFSFTMLTLGIAATIALLLGAIGLYGVLSYAVSLRTREIGVRIALGAAPAQVKRDVIGNAAIITAIGLVIGALGAAGLTRYLGTLLYETQPLDLATFISMSALLFVVALMASYLPARKAASVSPMEAMRSE